MKSIFLGILALTCYLAPATASNAQEPVKVVTFPSGKQVKVISVVRLMFTEAKPGLMLNYQTDLSLDDVPALEKEADEIWSGFRIDVEKAGLGTGIVRANEKSSEFIVTTSRAYGFVYQRDATGQWARLPSKPKNK